jgi:two-component system response regulator AtoC
MPGIRGYAMPIGTQLKRILVVDDEAEICFVITKALEDQGYAVESAYSGEEALESIRRSAPDLVLLDIRMPGMDGVEVLTRIRTRHEKLCVVIVSAFEHVDTAVRCMRLGAYDYLCKPINVHELRITVANAFRTQTLEHEVERLKGEIGRSRGLDRLIGESAEIRAVCKLVRQVSAHDISVLVTGESGTGKEAVAEAIHMLSPRGQAGKPFVTVDCAALPEHLFESELFGFEKGAFTGAVDRRMGRFELAQGGTLFLDEIGNLPGPAQVKLLRVLQERQVSRLGSTVPFNLDVRIVAATNADLEALIARGDFRQDLYYRLNETRVHLPPLRERGDDVGQLALHFLHSYNLLFGRQIQGFSPEALELIRRHPWTGNVRELQNSVKRAVILADDMIKVGDLPADLAKGPFSAGLVSQAPQTEAPPLRDQRDGALRELELTLIQRALKATKWNKVQCAKVLQIDYKTLYNKMKEYQIQ